MTTMLRPAFGGITYDRSLLERAHVAKRADGTLTVAQAFASLLTQIEPTPADRTMASKQQVTLRVRLDGRLEVVTTYLSGSYRRWTIIRPLDDIDVLVILKSAVYGDLRLLGVAGAQKAIALVANALAGSYPNQEREPFEHGVRVKFAGTGIGFDVVPVLQFADDEFWMPSTRRGWIRTNPRAAHELVSAKNQDECEGWLVPLVKLVKRWAAEHRVPLGGYHIEAMVYWALKGPPENERIGVAGLFRDLALAVLAPVPDLWSEGAPASAAASATDILTAYMQLITAAERADAAVTAESEDRVDDAHAIWYDLFGAAYPETGVPKVAPRILSGAAAIRAIAAGAHVGGGSSGLTAPTPGHAGGRSSTSHGGEMDPVPSPPTGFAVSDDGARQWALVEAQVEDALAQFPALRRIDPAAAAADPALWPVRPGEGTRLHTVLVGEQRSNLGRVHQILVKVPVDAPATEPRVYRLSQHVRHTPTPSGHFVPRHPLRHQWQDGAMCTHARRDRSEGRLVTLLVYAADWLVRQDYYQLTGRWIGREIDARGRLRVNGRAPGAPRGSRRGARVAAR